MKKYLLSVCLLICSTMQSLAADTNKEANSLSKLQAAIESVLKETKTPGAAVAIVSRDTNEWLASIGKADVAGNLPVSQVRVLSFGL